MRIVFKAYRAQLFVVAVGVLATIATLILSGLWWVLLLPAVLLAVVGCIWLAAYRSSVVSGGDANAFGSRVWRFTGLNLFVAAYRTINDEAFVGDGEKAFLGNLPPRKRRVYIRRSNRFRHAAGLPLRNFNSKP